MIQDFVKTNHFFYSKIALEATEREKLTVEVEQKIVQLSVCTGLQRLLNLREYQKVQQPSHNMI